MEIILKGRVSVVTGAARGIGQSIALMLARHGSHVVINDLLETEGKETAAAIEALGVKSLFLKANVTQEAEVKGMFAEIMQRFGTVDILVNNAGGGSPLMVEDTSYDLWKQVIDLNLNAPFLCCKEVMAEMQRKRYGRIVNISSLAAKKISYHSSASYTAAKAGLLGFTRHLAYELAPYGVTVNAICPGGTLTQRIRDRITLEEIEGQTKRYPIGRWAMPEDQAKAVLYFVSDLAEIVTGQALEVDGGELLAWMDFESYRTWRKRYVK